MENIRFELELYYSYNKVMSKITEQLFLGSVVEASDEDWLKEKFVSHVINCTKELPNYFPSEFNYLKLNLLDSSDQSLYHVFDRVYEYITRAIANGGTVFIHCHAGISRSSSMAIYYAMKSQGWSFRRSANYVKTLHPKTDPNPGFIQQLMSIDTRENYVSKNAFFNVGGIQQTMEKTLRSAENFYHPYDVRARMYDQPQRADFSQPKMIESRGEILRKFMSGESRR